MDFRHQIAACVGPRRASTSMRCCSSSPATAVDAAPRRAARGAARRRRRAGRPRAEGGQARSTCTGRPACRRARVVVAVAGRADAEGVQGRGGAAGSAALKGERRASTSASPGRRRASTRRACRGGGARPRPMRPTSTATPSRARRRRWAAEAVTLLCREGRRQGGAAGPGAAAPAIAAGVTLAREFAQPPGQPLHADLLGQQAKKLGKEFGLKVEVLDRKEIEKLGMGSFLAVAQGSDEPPRFIVAALRGRGEVRRRRSCWSARASPSTPAASRSSRRPRWTR